ncbi:hypothetical protein ACFVY1_48580, partial [Streptomyces sp. NPDC058293]|uniref:hypothetical protein n=1 Tax=Streptomyces sp. NPDC058293 TaxID=3346429 RepID=UPI0036F126FB
RHGLGVPRDLPRAAVSCDNAAQLSSWNAVLRLASPTEYGLKTQRAEAIMLTSRSVDGDALHVTLHHNVDVTTRAAAALEIEALIHTHRPHRVTVQVFAGEPTPATLSVVVRAHRLCKSLDIPLSLTGATTATQRLFTANTA